MISWHSQQKEKKKKRKKKRDKLNPVEILKICASKDNISKVKRQLTEWEKYLKIM